jgi:hypothetical protein
MSINPIKVSNPFTIKISNPNSNPNQAMLFRLSTTDKMTAKMATIGTNLSFTFHFVNSQKLYNPSKGP